MISTMTSHSDMGILTIEEVASTFSQDIPEWQVNANLKWLQNLHSLMAEDGIWGSPDLGTIYKKKGNGWILILDDDIPF